MNKCKPTILQLKGNEQIPLKIYLAKTDKKRNKNVE